MPINTDLTLNISGIYRPHSLNGKRLADACRDNSYFVREYIRPACRFAWQIEAIDKAMESVKGRERPYDRAAMLKTKALLFSMIGGIRK